MSATKSASKNTSMKLHEWQNSRKQPTSEKNEEAWVKPQNCEACGKLIPGAYGHSWLGERLVWSCSGVCEKEVQRQKGASHGPPKRD